MGFLLKPPALLFLATYYFLGLCCGPEGIPYAVDTHQAAPSVNCARRYHERAKYFSKSHAIEPPLRLSVNRSSLLQEESGGGVALKDEKDKQEEQHAGKHEEHHAGKHEEHHAGEHGEQHAPKHEQQHADKQEGAPSLEGSERSPAPSAAFFFPHLFHKAFKISKKATKHLGKCLEVLDDIKGNIDSLPHDAQKMQVLSEHVKIDVGKDNKSVHEIVLEMRDAVNAVLHIQGYLSSAKSQINSQLRTVLRSSEAS